MVAGDPGRSARAGGIRRVVVIAAAVIGVGLAGASAGCRAADPAPGTAAAGDASATAPSAASGVPAEADAAAVRATIDAFNATAAAAPADQRQRLADLVEPARRKEVEQCAAAETTVRFEPVYAGLRALGGEPDPPSTTFALPTLARVYSGSRLIGTDLTTLQLVVDPTSGTGVTEAYLTPFCVN